MKCLKIEDKWIQLILVGKKDIELRRTPCKFRGRIALGNTKTKMVEGYAVVVGCQEHSLRWLRENGDRHRANEFIDRYAVGRDTLFAWFLKKIEREPIPYPYSFSTGSWCKAEPKSQLKEIMKLYDKPQPSLVLYSSDLLDS